MLSSLPPPILGLHYSFISVCFYSTIDLNLEPFHDKIVNEDTATDVSLKMISASEVPLQ